MANVTQMHRARGGEVTPEMRRVAEREGLDPEIVRREVAEGRAIIPANVGHLSRRLDPVGIGIAMRCKVNANIGSSTVCSGIQEELRKLRTAVRYGADTVMDLSTGGDLDVIRQTMIAESTIPLGTVPVYQMAVEAGDIADLSEEEMLDVIDRQARQGVDFMTIHAGLLREHLPLVEGRITGIVSRGGALLAEWMTRRRRQNPLYERFDEICEIFRRYDVSFSLGDGLRPGCLHDASDEAQFAELRTLGELTLLAWRHDVQVMIEGPGHVPLDQVPDQVAREMRECHGAPFYTLGPIVTDVAAGYDHIASAIGAAVAAQHGASLLCYVTPREHLGLPREEDVRQGMVAYRIAAHAADVARRRKGARDRDDEMSRARAAFDWERQISLALDPDRAREYREADLPAACPSNGSDYCSMCGPRFCAMKVMRDLERFPPPGPR